MHSSPCKLVLTQDEDLVFDLPKNAAPVLGPSVLQDVLYDIVAVLIHEKTLCLLMKFLKDWCCLFRCAVLQDALNNSTPIRMR